MSFPSLAEQLIWTYTCIDGETHSSSLVHTMNGVYKVKMEWTGTGGSSTAQLDNLVIGGTCDSSCPR
ncbi:MAG: hypothetical protein NT040_00465 [Bacteroidetes bacterium]|nr:hypothetical protein [Bacteroidota bacterium]